MVSVIYNTVTSFSGDYSNDLEQLSPITYVITSDTKLFWQNYSEVASPESVSQLFRKCLKNKQKKWMECNFNFNFNYELQKIAFTKCFPKVFQNFWKIYLLKTIINTNMFEVNDVGLVFLLSTLNIFHTFF